MDILTTLVAPFTQVIFVLGNDEVSWAELLGFVTGGACVFLTVRASVANFPVGIANSTFFLLLFLSTRLWADAGLQVLYIALGFAGWWQWLYGGAQHRRLEVRSAGVGTVIGCAVFVGAATMVLYPLLHSINDSAPFLDALTTALSLAAQWLLNGKRIQNWYFWIAADIIYVPLYAGKGLMLTAVVYVLFLALCIAGLRAWRRQCDVTAVDVAEQKSTSSR
ncbi:nicotinamide mononucleotide transporter [Mycobacterium sp. OAE908]|uniref:nicotinamide riboside transporter PnuC n=1 Tax=Mycobacterium sp. OAE908 TaxID=2817899 RepID=UPI0034E27222